MGLVASQARLLLLFGRKSDIEYRCQVISNKRMRLSFETGEIARTYVDALSNTAPITIQVPNQTVVNPAPAPTYTQTISQAPNTTITSAPITSITMEELAQSNLKPYFRINDKPVAFMPADQMYQLLLSGELYLKQINPTQGTNPDAQLTWAGGTVTTTRTTTSSQPVAPVVTSAFPTPPEAPPSLGDYTRLYTEDDAQATARYEGQTAILQAEDKRLELELKNLETQHKAVSTEIDAVNKVIDKNIEKSFKTLG